MNDPGGYLPDKGLVDAVNVALLLGQPLLITGEPGTGKTLLAYHVAREQGFGEPLKFEVKSTTTATDLFYVFDSMRQFRDARANENIDARRYISFNALGIAILLATDTMEASYFLEQTTLSAIPRPKRSLVLIDEIDKAPRDVPNDILNEVLLMHFTVVEAENRRISARDDHRPVLILTSNSEKNLPDPFLRRCVYYDIPFPTAERLGEIVATRIASYRPSSDLLKEALELFERLRDPVHGVRKRPGTAELLNWLWVLRGSGLGPDDTLRDVGRREKILNSLSALAKTREDQVTAQAVVEQWISRVV